MKQKIWNKNNTIDQIVEKFTIGNDAKFDLYLAKHDVFASKAHAKMLASISLISQEELTKILDGLDILDKQIEKNEFVIEEGIEDVHSQIEFFLTEFAGDAGKKIHTARSRNDQVLTAIKLYLKSEISEIFDLVEELFEVLIKQSNLNKDKMMVGYTHFQIAMPSSAGMWLAAYAESLIDDLEFLLAALNICDQNPLGSAAGYGSSFAINRMQTSKEMQFANLNVNSIYAQMTRGKSEKALATAMSFIASTLSKISYDVCLFMSQNFAFIKFPDNLTTGSSIMPHKKNPDVFELIRAKSNILQALPNQFTLLINNLPVGYHRDYQMTKELLFPAIEQIKELVKVSTYMFDQIQVNDYILQDEKYKYIFSVEEVNKLVQNGVAFRDAYKQIGIAIEKEEFNPDKKINHSHIGSLGNLSNELIQEKFQKIKEKFQK